MKKKNKVKNIYSYTDKRTDVEMYRIVYRYKNQFGVEVQTTKRGFLSSKEAENALIDIKSALNNNDFHKPNKVRLDAFLKQWLERKIPDLRPNTICGYKNNIEKHIIPYIGGLHLQKIKVGTLENLYSVLLKKGLNKTSVKYVHAVLRAALESALKDEYIYRNPAKLITRQIADYKYCIYDENEISEMLAKAKDTEIFVPILLAVLYGLRRGEVLGLKWSNVDLEKGILHIIVQLQETEGELKIGGLKSMNSTRVLPLTPTMQNVLKELKERQDELEKNSDSGFKNEFNQVVCQQNGMLKTPSSLSHAFSRFIMKNKLKKLRFHDLRHSLATALNKRGEGVTTLSGLIGDTKETTLIYLHSRDNLKSKAFLNLEKDIEVMRDLNYIFSSDGEKVKSRTKLSKKIRYSGKI